MFSLFPALPVGLRIANVSFQQPHWTLWSSSRCLSCLAHILALLFQQYFLFMWGSLLYFWNLIKGFIGLTPNLSQHNYLKLLHRIVEVHLQRGGLSELNECTRILWEECFHSLLLQWLQYFIFSVEKYFLDYILMSSCSCLQLQSHVRVAGMEQVRAACWVKELLLDWLTMEHHKGLFSCSLLSFGCESSPYLVCGAALHSGLSLSSALACPACFLSVLAINSYSS